MTQPKRYTTDSGAYQTYLQARYHLQRAAEGEREERQTALQLFQQAVEKDPGYALAWAGLAHGYAGLGWYNQAPPGVTWPRAEAAAQKALQLDGDLSEAHSAMGAVKECWYSDFAGAEREFLRALELNPGNWWALRYYAYLLCCMGRFDEAITVAERAIERDPLNRVLHQDLANECLLARRYDRAIQESLVVLGMDANYSDAYVALSRAYTGRREYEKAIAYGQRGVGINGGPRAEAFLSYALAMAGRKSEANEILQELKRKEHTSPYFVAIAYAGLGDRETALSLLEKLPAQHSTLSLRLKTEPALDSLRSDARFAALLERAGFRG